MARLNLTTLLFLSWLSLSRCMTRRERFLSIFNIVSFQNSVCSSDDNLMGGWAYLSLLLSDDVTVCLMTSLCRRLLHRRPVPGHAGPGEGHLRRGLRHLLRLHLRRAEQAEGPGEESLLSAEPKLPPGQQHLIQGDGGHQAHE